MKPNTLFETFALRVPNYAEGDLAVACTQGAFLSIIIILVGVALGFTLFISKKNKKRFLTILIGSIGAYAMLVALGKFFVGSAIAQVNIQSSYPYPEDQSYSCPNVWEQFIEKWPNSFLVITLLTIATFLSLSLVSVIAKRFRKADASK